MFKMTLTVSEVSDHHEKISFADSVIVADLDQLMRVWEPCQRLLESACTHQVGVPLGQRVHTWA